MLDATVHLPDDLNGFTRFVVQREEEDRRVHDARGLFVEGVEQLSEVTRVGAERSKATRGLESRAKLITCSRRAHHPPTAARRVAKTIRVLE